MDTSDFVDQPVQSQFICSICLGVLIEARSCKDGHTFCLACISEWLVDKRKKTCQMDRSKLKLKELSVNRPLDQLIAEKKVRCKLSVGPPSSSNSGEHRAKRARMETDGCPWIGFSADVESHDQCCEFVNVQCSHPGCEEEIHRGMLPQHLDICDHREQSCEFCHARMKYYELQTHFELDCELLPISCCHTGCDEFVSRNGLEVHQTSCQHRKETCEHCFLDFEFCLLADHVQACSREEVECGMNCGARFARGQRDAHIPECPLQIVTCPFAEHGCEVTPFRRDFESHQASSASEHSRLLATKLAKVEAQSTARAALAEGRLARLEALLSAPKASVTWRLEGIREKMLMRRADFFSETFALLDLGCGEVQFALKASFNATHLGLAIVLAGGDDARPVCLGGSEVSLLGGGTRRVKAGQSASGGRGWSNFATWAEVQGLAIGDAVTVSATVRLEASSAGVLGGPIVLRTDGE